MWHPRSTSVPIPNRKRCFFLKNSLLREGFPERRAAAGEGLPTWAGQAAAPRQRRWLASGRRTALAPAAPREPGVIAVQTAGIIRGSSTTRCSQRNRRQMQTGPPQPNPQLLSPCGLNSRLWSRCGHFISSTEVRISPSQSSFAS